MSSICMRLAGALILEAGPPSFAPTAVGAKEGGPASSIKAPASRIQIDDIPTVESDEPITSTADPDQDQDSKEEDQEINVKNIPF